ncbi:MAG TPA: hypothetical protein PLH94_03155 [Fimbriimonadaceae bacterium]|nr:hypothetical protein [Fimbriimonadaceae bacterium]
MDLGLFERGDCGGAVSKPVPWHTQVLSREFFRADDPELAIEIACRTERNNLTAARIGLPTIGQELENRHGLRFRVQSHVYLPNVNTAHRWNLGEKGLPEDLYPVIEPLNMSKRFMDFIGKVDRCTTKVLVPVDTMPGFRRDAAPRHNFLNSADPHGLLLFLDAATLHETIFAHEIGHAWVQYVDQCEDERTLADVSDPARSNQVNFIQSYVLDLKVNELLRRKGFDMEPIDGDQAIAMNNMARLLDSGFSPSTKREAVFEALQFAEQIVERERGNRSSLVRFDDALCKLKTYEPAVHRLASAMAEAVFEHGTESKEGICSAIDECLTLAFEFTGDPLDLDNDLVIPPTDEPDFDKWPDWIPGANVRSKCQVGRVMALHDIPDDCKWSLSCERISGASLSFEMNDGSILGPWRVSTPYSVWNLHQMKQLDNMNKEAINRNSNLMEEVMQRNKENLERQQAPMATVMGPSVPTPPLPGFPNRSTAPHVPSPGMPFPTHIPGRRPYMAGLGRFLTEARLAERLQGEHPYAYAFNNPTTYIDPDALYAIKPIDCKGCGKSLLITPSPGDSTGIVVGPPKGKPGNTALLSGKDCVALAKKLYPGKQCICVNGGFFSGTNPMGSLDPCNSGPVKGVGSPAPPGSGRKEVIITVGGDHVTGIIGIPPSPGGKNLPGRTGACVDKRGRLVAIVVTAGCSASNFERCARSACPPNSRFVWLDGGGSTQVWGSGGKEILLGNASATGKPDRRSVDNWIIICG